MENKRPKTHLIVVLLLLLTGITYAQEKKFRIHTVAFYNCENLFDTIRDPKIYDEEWTPNGAQAWTSAKYNKKINNLTTVMSQIGTDENPNMPTIIGLAEIENRTVLESLVRSPKLKEGNYGIVHYDSPDRRGIDVGFLYQKEHFTPTTTSAIPLYIYDYSQTNKNTGEKGKRIYTRDQLLVTGELDGEEIHIIVNHWPSRVGGEKKSSPNREAAAALNVKIIDSLQNINANAKIITMGDMNDGPMNKSIKKVLKAEGKKENTPSKGIFNPMEKMTKEGLGTLAYRDAWDIFDQILITESFLNNDYHTWKYWKAKIFSRPFMITQSGQYKGYPLRNSSAEPGYSDHFPVYITLIREENSINK